MPTVIHMLVEVSVPVPDKDAIGQMVVTQALTAAAEAIKTVVKEREGVCTVSAQVKRVRGPELEVIIAQPTGNTPETMPVSLT